MCEFVVGFFFFQAEDGIRDLVRSRGLGDVYKRQLLIQAITRCCIVTFPLSHQPSFLNTDVISAINSPVSYTHLTLPTIYSV